MKPSFVTWQLRRLHVELDAIDKKRGDVLAPGNAVAANVGRSNSRDRVARRALLDRMLRSLPKRMGFRDARGFVHAFARANELPLPQGQGRRRLTPEQVQELERRILCRQRPSDIAAAIGCAEQTVMNRGTLLRKRLTALAESDGTGI